MNVLLVSSLERGGPLEQALLLAPGLVAQGAGVAVLCADADAAQRFEAVGVSAQVLPLRPGVDLAGAGRLWRSMGGADVVHAQDRRSGLWTRLAPGHRATARVYTVHGLPEPYLPPPAGPRRPSHRDRIAYELVDAGLCRRADAVIVPSRALADIFIRRLRFPADRVTVVPNGVAAGEPVPEPGREVGTLSLLEPVKDVGTFIDAVALLARDRPDVRFSVNGDGSQRTLLQRRARELGVSDRVAFYGYVPAGEVLRRMAILVLPSLMENSPMALLEAMAAGVPVVASRVGGIPEIVGEDSALLVEPGDAQGFAGAIARLLDDPALAAAQSAAARARIAARHTAEINAAGTLAVYERVVGARRAGGV